MPGHKIYVSRERDGLGYPAAYKLVKRAAIAALTAEGVAEPCEISALLTNDLGIHRLNLEFRGVDRPTDVLSFPAMELKPGEFAAGELDIDPETGRVSLGDMALSLERCAAQAAEYGHTFEREIMYLTVHSVLHLLGYDHEDEGEGKRLMRAREKDIMKQIEEDA